MFGVDHRRLHPSVAFDLSLCQSVDSGDFPRVGEINERDVADQRRPLHRPAKLDLGALRVLSVSLADWSPPSNQATLSPPGRVVWGLLVVVPCGQWAPHGLRWRPLSLLVPFAIGCDLDWTSLNLDAGFHSEDPGSPGRRPSNRRHLTFVEFSQRYQPGSLGLDSSCSLPSVRYALASFGPAVFSHPARSLGRPASGGRIPRRRSR